MPRTGAHLWADRYDRDLTDIFSVQDEITKTIVEQLKIKLLPQRKEGDRGVAHARTSTPTTTISRAAISFICTRQQHVLLAQRMFEKAVELDPSYARAYAGLADCAWFLYNDQHEGTTVDDIRTASLKALELDPDAGGGARLPRNGAALLTTATRRPLPSSSGQSNSTQISMRHTISMPSLHVSGATW